MRLRAALAGVPTLRLGRRIIPLRRRLLVPVRPGVRLPEILGSAVRLAEVLLAPVLLARLAADGRSALRKILCARP